MQNRPVQNQQDYAIRFFMPSLSVRNGFFLGVACATMEDFAAHGNAQQQPLLAALSLIPTPLIVVLFAITQFPQGAGIGAKSLAAFAAGYFMAWSLFANKDKLSFRKPSVRQ